MENKPLFKNYTEEQMNQFSETINNIILSLQDAQEATTSEMKGFYLNSTYIYLQDLPKDSELVNFILTEVFNSDEYTAKKFMYAFNFIELIFKP